MPYISRIVDGRRLPQKRDSIEYLTVYDIIYSKRIENGDCLNLEKLSKRGGSSRESKAVGALRIHLLLIYKILLCQLKHYRKELGILSTK